MNQFASWRAKKLKYLESQSLRSVHHASVMVPSIQHARSEISFLNHFLIKRGYEEVACRITAVDASGDRLESMVFEIKDPCVYSFVLKDIFSDHGGKDATTFIVDFFCCNNLFYSLPAVMVNHRTLGSVSTVHAHLRLLNDVFEDDWVRKSPPVESSIDVTSNAKVETFIAITAGTQGYEGPIHAEIVTQNKVACKAEFQVDISRFQTREITISDMFPEIGELDGAILRVTRPHQFLLYGRLLVGKRHADGGIIANHSFYDYSSIEDYFDSREPWAHTFPYWRDLGPQIRVYPTQSPSTLSLSLTFRNAAGKDIGSVQVGELVSPGDTYIDTDVTARIENVGLLARDVASFVVIARSTDDRVPSRFNHQLVLADPNNGGQLPASINIGSQHSERVSTRPEGYVWGQMLIGSDVDTRLGFTTEARGRNSNIAVEFYDETGLIASKDITLAPGGCFRLDATEMFKNWIADQPNHVSDYIWYLAKGGDPSLRAISVARNNKTRHICAEHNF